MSTDLSAYWSQLRKTKLGWVHPEDEELLGEQQHSFNLDFPPPAFVGNVNTARIIILMANGGYDRKITPEEFGSPDAEAKYAKRLAKPEGADWKNVAPYYQTVNYANLILSGRAAVINACAYRSPRISKERENQELVRDLKSSIIHRNWLVDTILPELQSGKRLVIGKRHGLWALPNSIRECAGFIADPAPVSRHLSNSVWARLRDCAD